MGDQGRLVTIGSALKVLWRTSQYVSMDGSLVLPNTESVLPDKCLLFTLSISTKYTWLIHTRLQTLDLV